ncbi:aluminum-activated malate transporter 8-like [Gossypium australe]|uniref:Aluminum-activated malate transporter 8-like n=1 Tax=Gossypium australe TaxID=47621 RepID=A0A5B6VPV8_9ROSI|nr:aluminum-activated malate transporter 8-like [Gossypium australe]
MASSTVIAINVDREGVALAPPYSSKSQKKKLDRFYCQPIVSILNQKPMNGHDMRKVIHSVKVGVALVLVSLLYLLGPLYKRVGENAMWAIMTVVVIFEGYTEQGLESWDWDSTRRWSGMFRCSFCASRRWCWQSDSAGATYTRQIPNIKKKYDYGALIFILTFNLVVVSGLRADQVLELARDRLATIVMGFAICIFISLLVFPIWAGDELHHSLISRFEDLARSLEGFSKEYFENDNQKEKKSSANFSSKCKSILHSKAKDESLVNFARWEPWHGKFGFSYPWGKYLKIGEDLRDLAIIILSLKGCHDQSSEILEESVKEACEGIIASLAWTIKELAESIKEMSKCRYEEMIVPKMKSVRIEVSAIVNPFALDTYLENTHGLGFASFVHSLMKMVEKLEELAKEVEELGQLGGFHENS